MYSQACVVCLKACIPYGVDLSAFKVQMKGQHLRNFNKACHMINMMTNETLLFTSEQPRYTQLHLTKWKLGAQSSPGWGLVCSIACWALTFPLMSKQASLFGYGVLLDSPLQCGPLPRPRLPQPGNDYLILICNLGHRAPGWEQTARQTMRSCRR